MEETQEINKENKSWLVLAIAAIIILVLYLQAGGSFNLSVPNLGTQSWTGYYYPGGDTLATAIHSPVFSTKEECRSWAIDTRRGRPNDWDVPLQDLFECGKNCKVVDPQYDLSKCDETLDGGDF